MAEVGLDLNHWHLPPNESRGEGVLETVWVPLLDWQTSFGSMPLVQPEHLYAGQATTLPRWEEVVATVVRSHPEPFTQRPHLIEQWLPRMWNNRLARSQ